MLERVRAGRHPAEVRLVLVLLGTGLRGGHHEFRLGFGHRLGAQHQLAFRRRVRAEEVASEHLVVNALVLMAADEGGPPGPVEVDQVVGSSGVMAAK